MDEINSKHQWNPKYFPHQISDDQTILLAENDSLILRGEHIELINRYLGSSTTAAFFATTINDPLKEAQFFYTVNQMQKNSYIESLRSDSRSYQYCQPDYKLQPFAIELFDNKIELIVFSQYSDTNLFVNLVKDLNITKPTTVIVVDDYLDPRLNQVNTKLKEQQKPWLLLKLTGERPLVGPYFAYKPKQACWQCLSTRMWSNQPVRKWISSKLNAPIAVPVLFDREKLSTVLDSVRFIVQEFISTYNNNSISEINVTSSVVNSHPISNLQNCPSCGDVNQFENQVTQPIQLNNRKKILNEETGSRSVSASQTYKLLSDFISPVSGLIQEIREIPQQSNKAIKIYRSSFPKIPFNAKHIDNDVFTQVSLGKGINSTQTKVSALCESIERAFAQYQGDEPKFQSSAKDIDYRCVLPRQLVPISEKQYRQTPIKRYDSGFPIYWTPVWSLTKKERVYLPFTYCYANTPFDDDQYCQWNSNGCAAGNNIEEAMLQGFYELVERDSAAIWWYNKIERPGINLSILPEDHFARIKNTLDSEWEYWALDITHDFNIPVVAAIGQHKESKKFVLGFGCHLNKSIACVRALTELCQLIPIRYENASPFDFDAIKPESFLMPNIESAEVSLSPYNTSGTNNLKDDIELVISTVENLGLEPLVLNYTRYDFAIKTVKVVIPGMCHIWPQFGNARLYSVPVKMGWKQSEIDEKSLNPQSLLI